MDSCSETNYYVRHQADVRIPAGLTDTALRRGQRGAIHSIAAHFAQRQRQPAIVVMPTGSGKTAVMAMTPFLLEAHRVLVLTPSRLVRDQIRREFEGMHLLRAAGVLVSKASNPMVHEVCGRITSDASWEELRAFDVVIATPGCVSPAYKAIPDPPSELFDVVLVDEAHHSPATTWNRGLASFPDAKRVLFTATPFRRDQREIVGRLIFSYPVADAHADGIFGSVSFVPTSPPLEETIEAHDLAIAQQAEALFRADREAGWQHALMVRTDKRQRADQLMEIYQRHTSLKLEVIHSRLAYSTVQRTVQRLLAGDLDGVICVNMLGEGFDLPNLKIAAIHEPHKSLAVTLQFIGRFARTGNSTNGGAKFTAIPNDISVEAVQLYEEGAVWQELVPGLIEDGVERELMTREVFGTFDPWGRVAVELEGQDLSLYGLRPYHHVKVFNVYGPVELDTELDLGEGFTTEYRWTSDEWSTAVLITSEWANPRWIRGDVLTGISYDLFIIYYNAEHRLLFINASQKHDSLYQMIADQFCRNGARPAPQSTVRKAQLGLTDHEFFMVGMSTQLTNGNTVSYNTLAGSLANRGIRQSDGRRYLQGHAYGRARDDDKEVTLGWSGSGKVWSNTTSRLPDFLIWCERLAERLRSDEEVVTGSELDLLRASHEVSQIPHGAILADWAEDAYTHPWRARYCSTTGQQVECQLLDLELRIDYEMSNHQRMRLTLTGQGMELPIDFRLDGKHYFSLPMEDPHRVTLERRNRPIGLIDYLNTRPLTFFFADFSHLIGINYFPRPSLSVPAFRREGIEVLCWDRQGVNIQLEFGPSDDGRCSIHDCVERTLLDGGCAILFYDHGAWEIADYIAVFEDDRTIRIELYHCKASGEKAPGARMDDLYEVCGQVIKSMRWVNDNRRLLGHLKKRWRRNSGRFVQGSMEQLEELIERTRSKRSTYRIVIVQPGVSQAKLSTAQEEILAAADDYVARGGCEPLRIIASA